MGPGSGFACPGRRGEIAGMTAAEGTTPRSRGTKCPSCRKQAALENGEGAGKVGCRPHPWSACNKKHAAEPQVQADHPAFPAQWFYGLYALSPVTMLFCHR